MRILHTSDWHIGKTLNQFEIYNEQIEVLEEIQRMIKSEKIDIFILAGDIYQHYNPSDDSIEIINEFLTQSVIDNPQTLFIIIPGNHDSSDKLNFGSKLFKENLKIIAKLNKDYPTIVEYKNHHLSIYTFPFIRMNDYRLFYKNDLEDIEISNTEDQFKDYIKRIQKNMNPKNFNIFVAHTSVDSPYSYRCESEDDTYGTISSISSNLFSNFDLVLLGHYHKYQKIDNHIFYSGSIYKYSRKEADQKKGVIIFDIHPEQKTFSHEFINITPKKDIKYIKGDLKTILNYSPNHSDYIYIEILDKEIPPNIKERISPIFKNVVEIFFPEIERKWDSFGKINLSSENLSEEELFREFLKFLYADDENQTLDTIETEIGMNIEEIIQLYKDSMNEFLQTYNS